MRTRGNSDEPDAEIGSAVVASAVIERDAPIEPEVVETDMAAAASDTPEPDAAESDTAVPVPDPELESEPGLSDAAMAELGIVASGKRPAGKRGSAPPVEEPVETAEPETVEPAAAAAAAAAALAGPAATSRRPPRPNRSRCSCLGPTRRVPLTTRSRRSSGTARPRLGLPP